MRRFAMYMHALHDIANMYREMGHSILKHVERELERLDDRLRQLLEEAHTDGNVFEQVRRKMTDDPNDCWDHTRAIGVSK